MNRFVTLLNAFSAPTFMASATFIFCMCASMISNADSSFGRLFTTPAERAELNYLRQTTKTPVDLIEQTGEEEKAIAPVLPNAVSVQGYVKRNDGKKGTVWINNTPMQEGSSSDALQVGKLVRNSNQVQLNLPANNKRLRLKAGQVYDPETNTVQEVSAHAKAEAEREAEEVVATGADLPANEDGRH